MTLLLNKLKCFSLASGKPFQPGLNICEWGQKPAEEGVPERCSSCAGFGLTKLSRKDLPVTNKHLNLLGLFVTLLLDKLVCLSLASFSNPGPML